MSKLIEYIVTGLILAWYGVCLIILLIAGVRLNGKGVK